MHINYIFVILLGLFIVACGKKGPVEPLEQSKYPRTYPKPLDDEIPTKQKGNEVKNQ